MKRIIWLVFCIFLVAAVFVTAHEEEVVDEPLKETYQLKQLALWFILAASVFVVLLSVIAIVFEKKLKNFHKVLLFLGITIPVLGVTFFSAGSTIYINSISETKGPVHWHADFEIWDCGEKLDLVDPTGIMNRIGTPLFHEHNDFRIHVEGVVLKHNHVSLSRFFEVVGGSLEQEHFTFPTNAGVVERRTGELCQGEPGEIQVFVYHVENPDDRKNGIYTQQKISDLTSYVLAPYSNIPPGDCIIIEFGPEKEETEKICESYRVAESRGELRGG